MSQVQWGSGPAAAALVGSLAEFSLVDVLDLLARTGQTGELQVVGQAVDERLGLDGGELVADGDDLTARLFDLARLDEGWFHFTVVPAPDGGKRVPVADVVEDLGPQVAEWRELAAAIPFDAIVAMSATTPGDDVQIRAGQWKVLSLVGSPGRPVRDVVAAADAHPLETLRTLHELAAASLISVEEAPPAPEPPSPPPPPEGVGLDAPPPTAADAPLPPPPPPPTGGWVGSEEEGPGRYHSEEDEPPLPPFAGAPVGGAPATGGRRNGAATAAETKPGVPPPPITTDPWSSSLGGDGAD